MSPTPLRRIFATTTRSSSPSAAANLAAAQASVLNTWFGGNAPAGLQIGNYTGGGVGLGTGGDGVNIYNSTGTLQASLTFGASPAGPFATFDNARAFTGAPTPITQLSVNGTNAAFIAVNDANEIGSPARSWRPTMRRQRSMTA